MKVALSFPGCYRRGGVERIMFECARFLASRGHDVNVYADEWQVDDTQSIQYHHVATRKIPGFLYGASYFRQCTQDLQAASFDVLNTHGCVCPVGGVHWVQSVHRSWLERSRSFRGPLSLGRWKQRLNPLHPVLLRLEEEHFRNRAYQKVIATTPDVKADLMRLYDVPPGDVVVIPNGFSPTEFNPERRAKRRDEMRLKLGLQPDQVTLLFVANELQRKGYGAILSAMKQLRQSNIRLLVVGRPGARDVMNEAAEYGLQNQVVACGPTTDVAGFHAAADIFVLPTQYEAFCLAILEALGSGLPVITSGVPGAKDAIVPGVNGFIIEDPKSGSQLAAALAPVLEDRLRTKLSAAAPQTVEKYQWPVVLERYEQVLSENARGNLRP